MNSIKVGNRLDRHDIGSLTAAGVAAYALARFACNTVTSHKVGTQAARDGLAGWAKAKLAKADFVLLARGENYVRAQGVSEYDQKSGVFAWDYADKRVAAAREAMGIDTCESFFCSRVVGSTSALVAVAKADGGGAMVHETLAKWEGAKGAGVHFVLATRAQAQAWLDESGRKLNRAATNANRNGKALAVSTLDFANAGLAFSKK